MGSCLGCQANKRDRIWAHLFSDAVSNVRAYNLTTMGSLLAIWIFKIIGFTIGFTRVNLNILILWASLLSVNLKIIILDIIVWALILITSCHFVQIYK